jgi:hypothetical protein
MVQIRPIWSPWHKRKAIFSAKVKEKSKVTVLPFPLGLAVMSENRPLHFVLESKAFKCFPHFFAQKEAISFIKSLPLQIINYTLAIKALQK